MSKLVHILDYGAGNLKSVHNAFIAIGATPVKAECPEQLDMAERLVLPGVGAFGAAARALDERGLTAPLRAYLAGDRPFLGICLGQQLLFGGSEESPGVPGLSVLAGGVAALDTAGQKVPQVGWNTLCFTGDCPLFAGLPDPSYVYFTHSYCVQADCADEVAATTEYGSEFHAAVWKNRLFAVQFHPEKSGDVGLKILKNFMEL